MTRSNSTFAVAALAVAALALGACSGRQVPVASSAQTAAAPAQAQASLYDRLGGKAAIEAVADQFIANVGADTRINFFFADTDPADFKTKLVDQLCQATGGPCVYKGRDMKTSHAKFRIKEEHWDALVQDLIAALDRFSVPEREKGELLGLLAPMKGDIVNA